MEICKTTKWLCENAHTLERYSGKLVLFNTFGVMKKGSSLGSLLRSANINRITEKSFVFHVPSKRELANPLVAVVRP